MISIDNQLPLLGTVAMSENQQIRTISLVTSIKSLVQHEKEDKQQTSFQNLNDKKISPTSKSNEVIKIKEKPLKLKMKNHGNVWPQQLIAKLQCLHSGGLEGVFLYHMRKAAGTTIRNILTDASSRWQMPFFETEGPTLNSLFLNENFLTVTSLRDPIERIQSLYWYEHVGWFHGVKKETEKCKSFKVWVDAWRDGSKWKTEFITENPSSVYVEIENYYVKALSGWIGPDPISEKDYLIAIDNLNKFDIIYVTEWMNLEGQVKAMNSVFSMQATVMKHSAGNFRRLVERVGDEKLDSGHEVIQAAEPDTLNSFLSFFLFLSFCFCLCLSFFTFLLITVNVASFSSFYSCFFEHHFSNHAHVISAWIL